jgi:hypothetical protein
VHFWQTAAEQTRQLAVTAMARSREHCRPPARLPRMANATSATRCEDDDFASLHDEPRFRALAAGIGRAFSSPERQH